MWFLILTKAKLNENWSVGNELHHRRFNYFSEQKQWVIRPWVDFTPIEGLTGSFGYSYVRTTPFGADGSVISNEHNIWEQITLDHDVMRGLSFNHRFRLEHREIGINKRAWTDDTRFRYRLTSKINISKSWYLHLFNEIWLNVNEGIHVSELDRNWIYLGGGYRFNEDVSVELAYLDQWIHSRGDYVHNRGLQFTLNYNFDFSESGE